MADYLPVQDAQFALWATNFADELTARAAALGFTPGEVTALADLATDWETNYATHLATQDAARSMRQAKDEARRSVVFRARAHARRLQAHPSMTDEIRAAFRITVPDGLRSPVAAPTTRPVATVDTSQRFRHVLRVADETAPSRVARPSGVVGVQVWVKLGGTLPVDMDEVTFKVVSGRPSRVVCEYDLADGGKTAHYLLRWVNPRGATGPWSQTVSATIGG